MAPVLGAADIRSRGLQKFMYVIHIIYEDISDDAGLSAGVNTRNRGPKKIKSLKRTIRNRELY
jgi:hypothetical protein